MPIQTGLFDNNFPVLTLPVNDKPVRPDYFQVSRIYLAKGSLDTPERRIFVEGICRLFPEAKIEECLDTPHNRIELNETDVLALHRTGK
jgi:hypothetical protein